jgi:hypothetical protein
MPRNCHVFANSCWGILIKAVGQPLAIAKKDIGKLQGNASGDLLDSLWNS